MADLYWPEWGNKKMASQLLEGLPLISETPASWSQLARENLDEVLRDHAWCEYKAASAGLGLLARFPQHDFLIRPMIALVQEEMLHFRQVTDLLRERGVPLGVPPSDPYVRKLRNILCAEGSGIGGLGDHLIVNAFIEARSCERFRVLSVALTEGDSQEQKLAEFYQRLADAEERHWETFRDLALQVCDADAVHRRITEAGQLEADLLEDHPLEPRMH
ncbi:MAG: tRNA isopentenyl-2-thiomethyl-A-37 hydroxylase MiaE [Planctomycetota bacterium]|nr:tRNA isopentenyl-2-thiomethyl-A-37 hydroxylase MiaE [Planctomycetota bacterium]